MCVNKCKENDLNFSVAGESFYPRAGVEENDLEHSAHQVPVSVPRGHLPSHQSRPTDLLQGQCKPHEPSEP